MLTYTLPDGEQITRTEYFKRLQFAEEIKKRAALFKLHMDELLSHVPLPKVPYTKYDIPWIWDDYRKSNGYSDIVEGRGKSAVFQSMSDPTSHKSTLRVIKSNWKEVRSLYPIEITSHLLKWYTVFAICVVDYPKAYYLTSQDYGYFFQLRGKERFESLQELTPEGLDFFTFIRMAFFKEASEKRTVVLRELLSDQTVIDQIKNNCFIVPAKLQFILTTPQVYNAFTKAKLEGKTLPLPLVHQEAVKEMQSPNPQLMEAFKQVLEAQKEGKEVEYIGGKI